MATTAVLSGTPATLRRPAPERSLLRRTWDLFRRNRLACVGLGFLLLLAAAALFAPFVAPYDPNAIDIPNGVLQPPSRAALKVTPDALGHRFLRLRVLVVRPSNTGISCEAAV